MAEQCDGFVCVSCTREMNRYRLAMVRYCANREKSTAHDTMCLLFRFDVWVTQCNTCVCTCVCRSLVPYYDCHLNVSSGLPATAARKAVIAEDVQERV